MRQRTREERVSPHTQGRSCKAQSGEKWKIENLVMSQKADKILKKLLYRAVMCVYEIDERALNQSANIQV